MTFVTGLEVSFTAAACDSIQYQNGVSL